MSLWVASRCHPLASVVAAATVSGHLGAEADVQQPRSEPERARVVGFAGIAAPLDSYEGYGLGVPLRAGADVRIPGAGMARHRLILVGEYARFSRWGIDTGFFHRGVQLDLGGLRAGWRWYPFQKSGFRVGADAGVWVAHDRIEIELPERDVRSTQTRLGFPFALDAGWTIATHVDVALRYTEALFPSGTPTSFGYLELAIGGRL